MCTLRAAATEESRVNVSGSSLWRIIPPLDDSCRRTGSLCVHNVDGRQKIYLECQMRGGWEDALPLSRARITRSVIDSCLLSLC